MNSLIPILITGNGSVAIARRRSSQAGFSLVEILISLVISAFILSGTIQLYVSGLSSLQVGEGISTLQNDARLALMLLEEDMRLVSYQGCSDPYSNVISTSANTLHANSSSISNLLENGLQAYEVDNSNWAVGTPLAASGINAIVGSDVVTVMFAAATATPLSEPMTTANGMISIADNPNGISVGDLLMISSCNSATLFRATDVTATNPVKIKHEQVAGDGGNSRASFNTVFDSTSTVHQFVQNTYFVGDNIRGMRALHRMDRDGNIVEMVEGVENMQILYGQRDASGTESNLNDDLVRYVAADDANLKIEEVDRILLSLLISTPSEISGVNNPSTFDLLGEAIAPGDNEEKMRKVFRHVIHLRNRKPYLN